ncbi:hypothetical protein HMPREF9344_02545 [Cutibacterium acnes HL097PA1]|nr:hypothetical protein HMPREF9344_02545 [Cutibacterium acnes HL097PA1]
MAAIPLERDGVAHILHGPLRSARTTDEPWRERPGRSRHRWS